MSKNNHLEEIELRSEEVQEILTKVPNWMIRWGNTLFLILFALLFLLSWVIKYPDVINSEAIVTTEIPPQKQYAKITGKLDTILVKDNQTIKQNTPLAIIENTADYKDVFFLKSIVDTITLKKNNFLFPIKEIPILFLGDIEIAYANFENSYLQYALNKKLKPYSNDAVANSIKTTELKKQFKSLESQKNINKTELNFKKNDLTRSKVLFDKGVISAKQYENKQLDYLKAERSYQNMSTLLSQLRESIANSKRTSRGAEITKVREEMILLKNTIQAFNQLKKTIRDWELSYVFVSKINGKVSFLNYWSSNQTVVKDDLVFTVLPVKKSSFIARLKTPSQNSGKIKIGQVVNVKLNNYPKYEFGVLKGKVKNISVLPDRNGFYNVEVKLDKELKTTYNKKIDFKHEMPATAEIIIEDLRLLERVFYNFRELFTQS